MSRGAIVALPEPDLVRPSLPRTAVIALLPLLAGIVLGIVVHVFAGPRMEPLHAKILQDIGINIILAVSLNIVTGMTGQFSLGHAGFMAIGGYSAAAVTYYGSIGLWDSPAGAGGLLSFVGPLSRYDGGFLAGGDALFLAACVIGGGAAALAGLLVGLPSLRLRGDYLAIVTLGFGEIVRILFEQSKVLYDTVDQVQNAGLIERLLHLGGPLGFTGIPFYTTLFWIYLFVTITLLVAYRLRESTFGRSMMAIRENEIAAEAMGVATTRYKVTAFVISAFFAGVAGSLFAHQLGTTLNPGELGFLKSIDVLIMVVLGGLGSISGSVLAATGLTILPELLRDPPPVWPAMLVIVLVLAAVKRRKGVRTIAILVGVTIAIEIGRGVAISRGVDLARYRMIFYSLALILIMILRPAGLLGSRELWHLLPRKRRSATKELSGGAGTPAPPGGEA